MSQTIFIPSLLAPFNGGTITGVILGPNGSASAPTYSFSANPGRGFFNDTTHNAIGVSVNGTEAAFLDAGGFLVPTVIDPSTYYFSHDWDDRQLAAYNSGGNAIAGAVNTVSAPLMVTSTQGVAYVNTSSTTAGGYIGMPTSYPLVKSTTITYTWRILFYMPLASTTTNRYLAFIGAFSGISATNTSSGPFAGPYIEYSDNLNSGNWVMGSAVNNVRTTGNSVTAPVFNSWNTLAIGLINGQYLFSLNGAALGSITDANITTSPASNQAANAGGIMILPDGTNFTTQRTLMIDRSDYYATGLTR